MFNTALHRCNFQVLTNEGSLKYGGTIDREVCEVRILVAHLILLNFWLCNGGLLATDATCWENFSRL